MENVLSLDVPVQDVLIVKGLDAERHLIHRILTEILAIVLR